MNKYSPRGRFPSKSRAHVSLVGNDAHAAEVQAVGVPAGADGGMPGVVFVGVADAGVAQEGEAGVVEGKEVPS
jgi:hypothetical protein